MRVGWTLAAIWALLAAPLPAAAEPAVYRIDQTMATIGFTVDNLGLFTSHGRFGRFAAVLSIDFAAPERSSVDVAIEAESVAMDWQQATDMAQSEDFFDVGRFKRIHYLATGVQQTSPDHFAIRGDLEMHGVRHPLALEAVLTGRHPDPAAGGQVADFTVTGRLDRSDWGMVASRTLISDRVVIDIKVRVKLVDGG